MFTIESPAVRDGRLDVRYGIDTPDRTMVREGVPLVSFPYSWSGAPAETVSYAAEYMDYDNAADEGIIWVHWIAAGIPASVTALAEDGARTTPGIIHGYNSWKNMYGPYPSLPEEVKLGYGGPAPAGRHTYELTLYALDYMPALEKGFYYADFRRALEGHVLDKAVLKMDYGH